MGSGKNKNFLNQKRLKELKEIDSRQKAIDNASANVRISLTHWRYFVNCLLSTVNLSYSCFFSWKVLVTLNPRLMSPAKKSPLVSVINARSVKPRELVMIS